MRQVALSTSLRHAVDQRQRRIFVHICAGTVSRRIVHRRHGQRHGLRRARRRAVVRHHGDRAVARGRRITRVVVENALQDRLVHRRRGRTRDREHPGRGRVAHRQARPGGRRRRCRIERERLHRIAIGPRRQRHQQRGEVGRVHIGQCPHRGDQHRRLFRIRRGHVLARPRGVQVHHRRIVHRRHGQRHRLRRARRRAVVRHHGDRAVARGRRVTRVVVENALQDRLVHRLRGRSP